MCRVEVQSISAVTLVVSDMARSVVFYDRLGLERVYGGPNQQFTSYQIGASYLNLQEALAGDVRSWGRVIFHVDDVDAVWAMLRDADAVVEHDPTDAPWGERYFHARDPDGHELSFARPLDQPVVRAAELADALRLHHMNEAEVPKVGSLDVDGFTGLMEMADTTLVAWLGGAIAGFVVLFNPWSRYASVNYRWFTERYHDFLYVDRVVVSPVHRRKGIGGVLYEHAITLAENRPLLAEVNVEPPNHVSMAFHTRFGFTEVGRRRAEDGSKVVAMLARPPTPPS